MNNLITYHYNNQQVDFSILEKNVMVNATEMANIYGKKVTHFLQNDDTKAFIGACLNSRNSDYLGVKNEDDLYHGKQKSGTWMHRVLALKFAAWLDPDFEVWVYRTIETILFSHAKLVEETNRERAKIRAEIESIRSQLADNDLFKRLEILELRDRQLGYQMTKTNRSQLDLFMGKDEEDFQ